MAQLKKSFEKRCQIRGWLLFIASAIFFTIASIRSGDIISFIASLFFLVACFVFLIPFFTDHSKE